MKAINEKKADKGIAFCGIGGTSSGNRRTKQSIGEKEKKARMPRKSEEESVFRCGFVLCKAEQTGFSFDSS